MRIKKPGAYKVYLGMQAAVALFFELAFTYNLVYQATVAGLSPLQLVLVGTVLEASVFLFEVPTGVVADVYSRRISIIIGMFLIGLGLFLEGSVPRFAAILLAQVLWGVGYTFTSGATQAWISDEIGEAHAGQAFLRGSQVGQIGGLAGILLSMVLAGVRINLPLQMSGVLFAVLGFCLILVMEEKHFQPLSQEQRSSWQNMAQTFRDGVGMVRRRPALVTILAVGLFYGLYSEGFDRLWVKLILDNFQLPALGPFHTNAWFGVINIVGLLLSAGAVEAARRRMNTDSALSITRGLLILTVCLIAGILAFALAGSFTVALMAYWVIYAARSVISPIYTTWVNQKLDSNVRATVISMSSQVDAIGLIGGGPALGLLGSLFSVRAAVAAAGLVLSPVVGLFARSLKNGRAAVSEMSSEV